MRDVEARIAGWKDLSLVDVIDHTSFTVWFSGCNFRCPWCSNTRIADGLDYRVVKVGEIVDAIKEEGGFAEYLHVTGGEPTLQPDALKALFKLNRSETDLLNSLSTNGSMPEVIRELCVGGLLDHIAIDFKAPARGDVYGRVIGLENAEQLVHRVLDSIRISCKYVRFIEIRTTFVPILLGREDVLEISDTLREVCRGFSGRLVYVVQQYIPYETVREELYRKQPRTNPEILLEIAREVHKRSGIETYVRALELGTVRIS